VEISLGALPGSADSQQRDSDLTYNLGIENEMDRRTRPLQAVLDEDPWCQADKLSRWDELQYTLLPTETVKRN